MWKCPVCDQENTAATVCPACGYDRTCDYEQHPTAFAVTAATPTHTLRRQWQAKQGSALADLIAEWYDAPQDTAAAERCFRRLADGGDPAAQYWLGIACAQGRGAKKDAAQALGWLRKAAQQGYARAQQKLDAPETPTPDQLFALYQQESDQAKRMEYLKKAAELGYAPAQAELGDRYRQGQGVEKNNARAADWYRKAAQQGDAHAQASMARYCSYGQGVKKDEAEAAQWFLRLARQDSPKAWYWLGECYCFGWGVEQNIIRAAECFHKAAQCYAPARHRQEELEAQLFQRYQQESDQTKRMEYLKKAAELGHTPAQAELGDCYAQGQGVKRNFLLAARWRAKAKNN